ncbi:hypothetical protein RSAG8_13821, partial [Rhizoctonia solani AG-8 WAC10335]
IRSVLSVSPTCSFHSTSILFLLVLFAAVGLMGIFFLRKSGSKSSWKLFSPSSHQNQFGNRQTQDPDTPPVPFGNSCDRHLISAQTKDLGGDEADGFDEVIYPVDFEHAGHIVDDIMVQ